ncbi:MAG: redoxin domain-containing protein [Actinomycetota bacterium]
MTQLVELQNAMPKFADAGIRLYAVSYDELGALEDFTRHHSITYDLLADKGSAVIREFGILNHHVTEEQVPYHGIPFPGTYLVAEDGTITAASFHESLAQRESAEGLIDAALGEILLGPEEPATGLADESGIGITLTYHGGGGVIRGGAIRRLIVEMNLPEGLHVYDAPVPDGMVATTVTLVGPSGLRSLPVEKPLTHPLELPGIGSLNVWSGLVRFVMPVWATDELASLVRADNPDEVTIEVSIAYQACDDRACLLPRTETVQVTVPVGSYVGPALAGGGMPGAETTTMDSKKWFGAMLNRGLDATPDKEAAVAYLAQLRDSYEAGPLGEGSAGPEGTDEPRREAG